MRFRPLLLMLLGLALRPDAAPGQAEARATQAGPDGVWAPFPGLIPPRSAFASAYDPVGNRVILFGGLPYTNDLWSFDLGDTARWLRIDADGAPPGPRSGATAIYDPKGRMIVFGGFDGASYRNETYALSLGATPTWSVLATTGDPPAARAMHTAIYDIQRKRMLVFGGQTDSGAVADLWELTLGENPTWTRLTQGGTLPPARYGHTAIYDDLYQHMVIFGGQNETGLLSDSYVLSFNGAVSSWSAIYGIAPPAMTQCSAVYHGGTMLLVGGLTGPPESQGSYDGEIWQITFGFHQIWERAQSPTNDSRRFGHASVFDEGHNRLVVLCGYGLDQDLEIHALDRAESWIPGRSWTLLVPLQPVPQCEYSMAYDPVGRRAVMFGGGHPGSAGWVGTNDAFVWSLADPYPRWELLYPTHPVQGPPGQRDGAAAAWDPVRGRMFIFGGGYNGVQTYNDLWMLGLDPTPSWTRTSITGSPSIRTRAAMIYDPVRDRLLVFGGHGSTLFNQVYELPLTGPNAFQWNLLAPTGTAPSPRQGATMIYDAARDRTVIFGGRAGAGPQNDTWELSLATSPPAWRQLSPTGSLPGIRYMHAAVLDSANDRMIVFGGYSLATNARSDVWELSLADPPAWRELNPHGVGPGPRDYISAIYDPPGERLMFFGGFLEVPQTVFSDTWFLNLDQSTATLASLIEADAAAGWAHLAWYVPDAALAAATVYRREDGGDWSGLGAPRVAGQDRLEFDDRTVTQGRRYTYRLGLRSADGERYAGEAVLDVPAGARLALEAVRPNPSEGGATVTFMLPDASPARIEVMDPAGRRIASREVGGLGSGFHSVPLAPKRLEPGIYLVRLVRRDGECRVRAVVLR